MATVGNPSDGSVESIIKSIPDEMTRRALRMILRQGAVVSLTAATGTASDTIADVGAAFSQTVINNNIKSLAEKINEILVKLNRSGLTDA